jgi:hypothetical protein
METPAPTRRRWFQFSLTTMFVVVAVFAVWLGYYANWASQRAAIRNHSGPLKFHCFAVKNGGPFHEPLENPPGLLWLFGEKTHAPYTIFFHSDEPGWSRNKNNRRPLTEAEQLEFERIKRLFPESASTMVVHALKDDP